MSVFDTLDPKVREAIRNSAVNWPEWALIGISGLSVEDQLKSVKYDDEVARGLRRDPMEHPYLFQVADMDAVR